MLPSINRSILILTLVCLGLGNIIAQPLSIDVDLHQKLSKAKQLSYQKFLKSGFEATKNQQDFDAKYYSLDLHLNPTTEILTATVEGVYEVVASSINQLELNFYSGMTITDVHLASAPGTQLSYTHNNDMLIINLGSRLLITRMLF